MGSRIHCAVTSKTRPHSFFPFLFFLMLPDAWFFSTLSYSGFKIFLYFPETLLKLPSTGPSILIISHFFRSHTPIKSTFLSQRTRHRCSIDKLLGVKGLLHCLCHVTKQNYIFWIFWRQPITGE